MTAETKSTVRSRRTTVKLGVTLPEQLAREARAEAEAIGYPSLSAYIALAVEEKVERDHLQDALDDILREQPITQEEREWADRVLHGR